MLSTPTPLPITSQVGTSPNRSDIHEKQAKRRGTQLSQIFQTMLRASPFIVYYHLYISCLKYSYINLDLLL